MDTTRELTAISNGRRHDLDALRAFAMYLGVFHHAAHSFVNPSWIIRDSQPIPWLGIFSSSGVHGFRMELFFLVSGFFTAMLCQKRGVVAMLKNRTLRILIPCLIALFTLNPLTGWIIGKMNQGQEQKSPRTDSPLVQAVRAGEIDKINSLLLAGSDANEADETHGMKLITIAAYAGHKEVVRLLLDKGVDPNSRNRSGSYPLHAAALTGRPISAGLLLERGADPLAKNGSGVQPLKLSFSDEKFTRDLTNSIGIPITDWQQLEKGRISVREILALKMGISPEEVAGLATPVTDLSRINKPMLENLLTDYQDFLGWDFWKIHHGTETTHLIYTNSFGHLWFLRDLCVLVVFYALLASTGLFPSLQGKPSRIPLPYGLSLVVILTALSNILMHIQGPGFGPDTTTGWLPAPHLIVHYAIFFLFGAYYFAFDNQNDHLGHYWWVMLPLAMLVFLPIGLYTMENRWLAVPVQTAYCWLMIVGLMGVFRRYMNFESPAIRYLSDSAYWFYLAHMVPVFAAQGLVRDWQMPAILKFSIVLIGVTLSLLLTYQLFVRYTPLGWLLNGPRKKT